MIKFSPTIVDDVPQITEWTNADPFHQNNVQPDFWLTGVEGSTLAGCVEDESGPVLYFRFDLENDLARMHTQFAPASEGSKRRTALAISQAIPLVASKLKVDGAKGIVYESTNLSLIVFMSKLGFRPTDQLNDYVLMFEEK